MTPLHDLATRLESAGLGTLWTDLFVGRRPVRPDTCLILQTYPGDANRIFDDSNTAHVRYWAIQVMARAESQLSADPLAYAAHAALPFRHQALNGTHYADCRADGMPAYIGVDENSRALVRFNVTLRHDLRT